MHTLAILSFPGRKERKRKRIKRKCAKIKIRLLLNYTVYNKDREVIKSMKKNSGKQLNT